METPTDGPPYPHGRTDSDVESRTIIVPAQEWTEEDSEEVERYLRQVRPTP